MKLQDINNFIKQNRNSIRREFWLIIIGAIIFTASFLWKDYLTDIEERFFPRSKGLIGRGLYVLVVTIILITFVVILKRSVGLNLETSPTWSSQFDDSPLDKDKSDRNLYSGDLHSGRLSENHETDIANIHDFGGINDISNGISEGFYY